MENLTLWKCNDESDAIEKKSNGGRSLGRRLGLLAAQVKCLYLLSGCSVARWLSEFLPNLQNLHSHEK